MDAIIRGYFEDDMIININNLMVVKLDFHFYYKELNGKHYAQHPSPMLQIQNKTEF